MATGSVRLTRDQLAEFLPNSRTIKAFENLFIDGTVTIPADILNLTRVVEEININAESGVERANLALGLLENINNTLENRIRALECAKSALMESFEDLQEEIQVPNPISQQVVNTIRMVGPFYPNSTNGIVGTVTNDSANTGSVGEIVTATQAVSQAMTSTVARNITSISLTAGQWDVFGSTYLIPAATTTVAAYGSGISTTSATLPSIPDYTYIGFQPAAGSQLILPTPTRTLQLAATTTVYLVISGTFSISTCAAQGKITAVRRR